MIKTKPKQETKIMRQQTGSRNRGWLSAIRRRFESYGGHVGNRLSVAAGVALVAGMMVALAPQAEAGWAKATGGTETDVGGYHIHTFTSGGTLEVTAAGDVEYLVVGGGAYHSPKGKGGSSIGGNGGQYSAPSTAPTAGAINTGSGGGGCAGHRLDQTSGAGGSGIVIVRYAIIAPKGTVIMMR
jgi:hypothetical protein